MSTGLPITEAAPFSRHLQEDGAIVEDLAHVKGISIDAMKKGLVILIGVLMSVYVDSVAQTPKRKIGSFQTVSVPDSIRIQMAKIELGKTKIETVFDSAYTAIVVNNLVNPKDNQLRDGIYSWKVMGPHFFKRLFIYNKSKVFVFSSVDVVSVLRQYLDAIAQLGLSGQDQVNYLNEIAKFLKVEFGKIYGAEIK